MPEAPFRRRSRVALLGALLFAVAVGTSTVAGASTMPTPESVIGADTRFRISGSAMTRSPYRKVVLIRWFEGGYMNQCSGAMVREDLVATAGHCVYDSGNWHTDAEIIPATDWGSQPYGSCRVKGGIAGLHVPVQWMSSQNSDFDYGAMKLDCSVGKRTGRFKLSAKVSTGTAVRIYGYPGDKVGPYPFLPATMWGSAGTVKVVQSRRVFYDNDTYGGMSGSPVLRSIDGEMQVVAIHTNGVGGGISWNSGVLMTAEARANFNAWAAS